MQKITYINLRGEALEIGPSPPYILSALSGVEPTDVKMTSTRGAHQHGETTREILREPREVNVTASIQQAERAAMYETRMRAAALLALPACFDGESMGRLIYENDAGRWWAYAYPKTPLRGGKRILDNLLDMRVTFHCDSPYWSAMDEEYVALQMGAGAFKLPFSFPIRFGRQDFSRTARNAGAVDAPVRIEIEGTGEAPTLYNRTTGAKIAISRVIARGERLVIDTDPAKLSVTVIGINGERENAFGYLDSSLAITEFVLRPGENRIEYVPSVTSGESRVTLYWRTLYEGA